MVSQTQNEEWEAPHSRNPATLLAESKQQPPGVRTPPSYFDAVRSRHSLSQPDSFKPEKPLSSQQVKYNSLPRPLPQRLQVPVQNGNDSGYGSHPEALNSRGNTAQNAPNSGTDLHGFRIYSKPPGPANHVPLSPRTQFMEMSSSASLPRCFPRTSKLLPPPPPHPVSANAPKDVQQPLSIIVQQNDYSSKMNGVQQAPQHKRGREAPAPDHMQQPHYRPPPQRRPQYPVPMSNGELPMHKSPYVNMSPPRDDGRSNSLQRNLQMNPDLRSASDANRNFQIPQRSFYGDPSHPREGFQYHNPKHVPNGSAMQFQQPPQRRNNIPEPVVSMRMGRLGTYPETPHHQPPAKVSSSQHLLKCANSEVVTTKYPPPSTEHNYRSRPDLQVTASQQFHNPPQTVPNVYYKENQCSPYPSSTSANQYHYPTYPTYTQPNNGSSDNYHLSPVPPPLPPSRKGLENGHCLPKQLPPEAGSRNQYANNSLRYGTLHRSPPAASSQNSINKNSEDDYYSGSQHKNMRETPEEAGLVMIVESLDLNNQVNSMTKDLVKPTPRMPVSPTQSLIRMDNNSHDTAFRTNADGSQTENHAGKYNGLQYNGYESNTSNGFSYAFPQSNATNVNGHWNDNQRMFHSTQTSSSQGLKSSNFPLLRRTPLSSSTASLSSEISSVSSKQWKPQNKLQKRYPGSVKVMHGALANGKEKNSEISPSPWTREEKEEMQKQQILGARQARDREISYLESLPERNEKQEEWLRILRLEREFQRRAEEIGDDEDDDDEDDALLERAEHRERILLMEKEMAMSESEKTRGAENKGMTTSSDQWLANSQAKQPPKLPNNDGSLLNTSFEVEQFNDLLETMNMSPVVRDSSSTDDVNRNVASQQSATSKSSTADMKSLFSSPSTAACGTYGTTCQAAPIPAPRISKTLSPIPQKNSCDVKAPCSPPADFCFPLDSAHSYSKPSKNTAECSSHSKEGKGLTSSDTIDSAVHQSLTSKPKSYPEECVNSTGTGRTESQLKSMFGDADAVLPKVNEKNQSKYAFRVPLSVAAKEKFASLEKKDNAVQNDFLKSTVKNGYSFGEVTLRSVSGDAKNSTDVASKSTSIEKNTYHASTIHLGNGDSNKKGKRPVSDGSVNSFLNHSTLKTSSTHQKEVKSADVEDKSTEYSKIWTSRPEKLTFMDKIRKFSLHAGEESVPRDKVKNSRAQRELEIKFNADNSKVIEQKAS